MIKIAVANLKGGVGKSTTTLFLAEHWAVFQRRKVLVVDLDPQGNASYMLLSRAGVERAEVARKTLPDLFKDVFTGQKLNPMRYIEPRASDLHEINGAAAASYVSIAPSIPKLWFEQHDFDRALYLSREDPVEKLAGILVDFIDSINSVAGKYDCVLFDCPPGFGTASRAALRLADHIIAPTIADYTSMRSLQDFVTLGLRGVLGLDGNRRFHVVISKFTGSNSQRQALDLLRKVYAGAVRDPVIPMRDQVQVVAERHATQSRTYAQKYGRPHMRPLKPHVKGLSDTLYGHIFGSEMSRPQESLP
jgi:cellulose biosynthesis protein BcsQ